MRFAGRTSTASLPLQHPLQRRFTGGRGEDRGYTVRMTTEIEAQFVATDADGDSLPPRYEGEIPVEGPLDPEPGVEAFLRALEAGEQWYPALLRIIARWTAAAERLDGVNYRYLLAGEAFDWLRLAQRLIEAAELWLPGVVPAEGRERLLFAGLPPGGEDETAFAKAIGPQKHRAHLNFQYGVVVEEALQLAMEQEIQKAGSLSGSRNADIEAYERVYGKPLSELASLYREETEAALGESVTVGEWQAFTYWLSKYRFRTAEPARVASDTRKALALLSTMDRHRRRVVRKRPEPAVDESAIDVGMDPSSKMSQRAPQTSMWERARRARGRADAEDEADLPD